ncbi:tetratricopeptide repeat protein [Cohnella cellulosilytica]|uniref:Tetratricopeptide repeat protein n=1 Tax=Cohnella cellulosilytica TaxID=986710 RepID=A0ABW2F232_9BACL
MVGINGETCIRSAYDAIFQGDFEAAVQWFGQAIELEPDNAEYYFRGSITCARSGKHAQAMDYAKKAADLDPEEPSYRLHLRMLQARERFAEARWLLSQPEPDVGRSVVLLREAVQLDPLSAQAKLLLGIAYRAQRQYDLALDSLRDALQLDPSLGEARKWLGEIRAERRRLLKQQYSHYHSKRNR